MKKYEEISNKEKNHDTANAWFDNCRKNQIPYITLTTRTRLGDVHWDYIAYPTEIDNILENHSKHIIENAVMIFKKYANNKSKYDVSCGLVYFNNLEITQAKLAAEEIFDLINNAVQENVA